VSGKGLAGGLYPVSACSFGERVEAFFGQDPFFHPSSFGGSELAAVIVEAVVTRLSDPGFLEHVVEMGERFQAGFEELCRCYPETLAGYRGKGLMMALQAHSDEQGIELARQSIENGVLAIFANNCRSALIVMPPLVISEEEVDEVLSGLDAALSAIAD
jgi:acetylornithine/succinyldiaminopimelate/putrescine aminotransferase